MNQSYNDCDSSEKNRSNASFGCTCIPVITTLAQLIERKLNFSSSQHLQIYNSSSTFIEHSFCYKQSEKTCIESPSNCPQIITMSLPTDYFVFLGKYCTFIRRKHFLKYLVAKTTKSIECMKKIQYLNFEWRQFPFTAYFKIRTRAITLL